MKTLLIWLSNLKYNFIEWFVYEVMFRVVKPKDIKYYINQMLKIQFISIGIIYRNEMLNEDWFLDYSWDKNELRLFKILAFIYLALTYRYSFYTLCKYPSITSINKVIDEWIYIYGFIEV
jgi:hypothetical protein